MIKDVSKGWAALLEADEKIDEEYGAACEKACDDAKALEEEEICNFDEREINPMECGFAEDDLNEVVDPLAMWNTLKSSSIAAKPAKVKVDDTYIKIVKKLLSGIEKSKKQVYDNALSYLNKCKSTGELVDPPETYAENFIPYEELQKQLTSKLTAAERAELRKNKDAENDSAETDKDPSKNIPSKGVYNGVFDRYDDGSDERKRIDTHSEIGTLAQRFDDETMAELYDTNEADEILDVNGNPIKEGLENDSPDEMVHQGKSISQWEKEFNGEFTKQQLTRMAMSGQDLQRLLLTVNGKLTLDDNEKLDEADYREPASHLLDPVGVKASTANLKAQDTAMISVVEHLLKKIDKLEDRIDENISAHDRTDLMSSQKMRIPTDRGRIEQIDDMNHYEGIVKYSDGSKDKFSNDATSISELLQYIEIEPDLYTVEQFLNVYENGVDITRDANNVLRTLRSEKNENELLSEQFFAEAESVDQEIPEEEFFAETEPEKININSLFEDGDELTEEILTDMMDDSKKTLNEDEFSSLTNKQIYELSKTQINDLLRSFLDKYKSSTGKIGKGILTKVNKLLSRIIANADLNDLTPEEIDNIQDILDKSSAKKEFKSDLDKLSPEEVSNLLDVQFQKWQDDYKKQQAAGSYDDHTQQDIQKAWKKLEYLMNLSYNNERRPNGLTDEEKKEFVDLVYKYYYDTITDNADVDQDAYEQGKFDINKPVQYIKDLLQSYGNNVSYDKDGHVVSYSGVARASDKMIFGQIDPDATDDEIEEFNNTHDYAAAYRDPETGKAMIKKFSTYNKDSDTQDDAVINTAIDPDVQNTKRSTQKRIDRLEKKRQQELADAGKLAPAQTTTLISDFNDIFGKLSSPKRLQIIDQVIKSCAADIYTDQSLTPAEKKLKLAQETAAIYMMFGQISRVDKLKAIRDKNIKKYKKAIESAHERLDNTATKIEKEGFQLNVKKQELKKIKKELDDEKDKTTVEYQEKLKKYVDAYAQYEDECKVNFTNFINLEARITRFNELQNKIRRGEEVDDDDLKDYGINRDDIFVSDDELYKKYFRKVFKLHAGEIATGKGVGGGERSSRASGMTDNILGPAFGMSPMGYNKFETKVMHNIVKAYSEATGIPFDEVTNFEKLNVDDEEDDENVVGYFLAALKDLSDNLQIKSKKVFTAVDGTDALKADDEKHGKKFNPDDPHGVKKMWNRAIKQSSNVGDR